MKPNLQQTELRLDPGATTSGIAIVNLRSNAVVFAAEIRHRGTTIRAALLRRRALRQNRRVRSKRHRAPRYDNRRRPQDWFPPSIQSRIDNVVTWARRLQGRVPITSIAIEQVRFDTRAMENPETWGVEYQQGELTGYEVREYLLEKWQRSCAYCDARNVPLEVEHIVARSRGGSSRISNLTLACHPCNQRKGNRRIEDFLATDLERLARINARRKSPLAAAAAVNAARYAIVATLKDLSLPVSCWTGGRTKYNRTKQGYPKAHWIDAACVGETGRTIHLDPNQRVLTISATGRGTRQTCRVDRYGFPCSTGKRSKRVHGFSSHDLARLTQLRGKYAGVHIGYLAVRERGDFDLTKQKAKITAPSERFTLIQRADGYRYAA